MMQTAGALSLLACFTVGLLYLLWTCAMIKHICGFVMVYEKRKLLLSFRWCPQRKPQDWSPLLEDQLPRSSGIVLHLINADEEVSKKFNGRYDMLRDYFIWGRRNNPSVIVHFEDNCSINRKGGKGIEPHGPGPYHAGVLLDYSRVKPGGLSQTCLKFEGKYDLQMVSLSADEQKEVDAEAAARREAAEAAEAREEAETKEYWGQLVGEMLLDIALFQIGLVLALAISWGTGSSKVPAWVTLAAVPFVIRSKTMEAILFSTHTYEESTPWSLIKDDFCEWKGFPTFPYLVSITGAIDNFQYGIACANAMLIWSDVKDHYLAGWNTGPISVLHSTVAYLTLAGLMSLAWVISSIWQLGALLRRSGENSDDYAIACTFVGFGRLAKRHKEEVENMCHSQVNLSEIFYMNATKLIGESNPHLFLLTGLAMVQASRHGGTDLTTTLSIGMSTVTCVQQSYGILAALVTFFRAGAWSEREDKILPLASMVASILGLTFSALMIARLCMMELCPSHMGSLTNGCLSPE